MDSNYLELKAFYLHYADRFMNVSKMPESIRPAEAIKRAEAISASRAKKGVEAAINDVMEQTSDWRPDQVAAFDAELVDLGLTKFSSLRRQYSKRYLGILKRGSIRSLTEYYIVKGSFDSGSVEMGAGECERIESMLNAYEARLAS